jgi:hypothetical protein
MEAGVENKRLLLSDASSVQMDAGQLYYQHINAQQPPTA